MNEKINELRARFYITTLDNDALKKEYEEKYSFKLFWGFWNCR